MDGIKVVVDINWEYLLLALGLLAGILIVGFIIYFWNSRSRRQVSALENINNNINELLGDMSSDTVLVSKSRSHSDDNTQLDIKIRKISSPTLASGDKVIQADSCVSQKSNQETKEDYIPCEKIENKEANIVSKDIDKKRAEERGQKERNIEVLDKKDDMVSEIGSLYKDMAQTDNPIDLNIFNNNRKTGSENKLDIGYREKDENYNIGKSGHVYSKSELEELIKN